MAISSLEQKDEYGSYLPRVRFIISSRPHWPVERGSRRVDKVCNVKEWTGEPISVCGVSSMGFVKGSSTEAQVTPATIASLA